MDAIKVLVPLDGSRTAEHSLVYIDALKRLGECEVELLSVADDAEDFHGRASAEAIEREANLLSTYLREVGHDIKGHLGLDVALKVVRGNPARCVAEEIEAFKPDVLVIATHGRTGVSRWRLGSVADKVIRGSTCTTLVVGPGAHADEVWIDAGIEEPFKQILVPLDGSELAETALPMAERYARCFGSTLHIVRVVGIPTYTDDGLSGASYVPDLLSSLEEAAAQHLTQVSARLPEDVHATSSVLTGEAVSQLESYLKAHAIDLIVMTTHGRGGFSRTALGSVTDRLLAEGTAPVLVVRAG